MIGHGPHVPRGVEVYRGRLIAYSLGNFATYGRFTIRGATALAPLLEVELGPDGAFEAGRIIAARQVGDDLLLEGELAELVGRAAAELRSEGLTARTVTVRIRDTDFTTRQASRTFDEALASDRALFAAARQLMAKLRRARRVPARLLGVALSNFTPPPTVQLALFDAGRAPLETPKDRELSRAVDAVRARFGRDAIAPGRKPRS